MHTALLFPGQGSQKVGMGRAVAEAFAEARAVFEEADDALGFAISKLCFEGPEEELTRTANTQPAILTTSIAVLRALQARVPLAFDAAAGHSLGEWTALVATGALRLGDAVRLVRLRGEAMQRAVPEGVGAMAAIVGLDGDRVAALCAEASTGAEVCSPANLNGGGQVVISGHTPAVDRAMAAAKAAGARLVRKLAVSAPFHCALMQPAADALADALAPVEVRAPAVPVYANVTAEPHGDPDAIKARLVDQVTAPVQWERTVQRMAAAGMRRAYEVGPGRVLAGLVKRIAPDVAVAGVAEPEDIDNLARAEG
ncbi:MAG: [acyl-carrier-protein] S-malonyltransferase [Deltaproteobacteria bacterium]|nr:MAG: [acyl-carrier-protein] S-malonyltransferase [Deltaproteobacteria bacterium]